MVFRRNFSVGREDELTQKLVEANAKIEQYKEVIRQYRRGDLESNPTPPITSQIKDREQTFHGPCRSGPYEGQSLVHWKDTYQMFKPMINLPWPSLRDPEIDAVLIGEYIHLHGQWMWRPQ